RAATVEKFPDECLETGFVALVGTDPTCLLFSFPRCLVRVGNHARDKRVVDTRQWPGTEQGLIDHIFGRARVDPSGAEVLDRTGIEFAPFSDGRRPLLGKL